MTEHQGPRAGPGNRDTALAERFVSLADTLVDDFDLVELLDNLVQSCVELLDVSAAGLLLVTEAGGTVTDAEGGEEMLAKGSVCAGNLDIHPLLLERLRVAA